MAGNWSAEVVGQMHAKHMTGKKLAELTGYTYQYVSMVLNGHRETEQARDKIIQAVSDYSPEVQV